MKDFFLGVSPNKSLAYERLSAIILNISNQSLGAGNKTNAGQAGEAMVRAIFNSVGLVKGSHYGEQYASRKGSNTDFVFPYVEDYNDSHVDAMIAVQFSTNDRGRLATSELKEGSIRYMVSGNGLPASTKSLKHIGSKILETFKDSNIRLVCFSDEIEKEKQRINEIIKKPKLKTKEKNENISRLKYIESNTRSFSVFSKEMKRFRT